MIFPVDGGRVTNKWNPKAYTDSSGVFHPKHLAWDIAPPKPGQTGIVCVAPEGGTVVRSDYIAGLEGHYVMFKGRSGKYWYFGHFASRAVKVGQVLNVGQKIGILGETGSATNIHTHMEYRTTLTGGQINPATIKWETPQEDAEMLTSKGQMRRLWLQFLGREPNAKEYSGYIGKRTYSYTVAKLSAARIDLPTTIKKLEDCQNGS